MPPCHRPNQNLMIIDKWNKRSDDLLHRETRSKERLKTSEYRCIKTRRNIIYSRQLQSDWWSCRSLLWKAGYLWIFYLRHQAALWPIPRMSLTLSFAEGAFWFENRIHAWYVFSVANNPFLKFSARFFSIVNSALTRPMSLGCASRCIFPGTGFSLTILTLKRLISLSIALFSLEEIAVGLEVSNIVHASVYTRQSNLKASIIPKLREKNYLQWRQCKKRGAWNLVLN